MRRTMRFFRLSVVITLLVFGMLAVAEEPISFQIQTSFLATSIPSNSINIRDAVEALRERYLIKELQLSEGRAQAVIEKMRYMRNLKKDYQLQQYRLESELVALFNISEHDTTKIADVLQKLRGIKVRYYQEFLRSDEEFHQILTPEEQAKYVLFQRAFNQKLKDAIADIRKQHAGESSKPSQIMRNQDSESVIRQPR